MGESLTTSPAKPEPAGLSGGLSEEEIFLLKRLTSSRRLVLLCAFALAALTVSMLAALSEARGNILLGVILIFTAASVIGLAVTAVILRLPVARAPVYWSGDAGPGEVRRIAMMIGGTLVIYAAAVALDLPRRAGPLSGNVVHLIVWTLVPAAFLGSGFVRWPERLALASRRQVVLTGFLAISFAALWSFVAVYTGPERPPPSAGYLLVVVGSLIIAAAAEEVMFRVLLLTALVDLTRSRFDAVALSAFAFGLAHAPFVLVPSAVHGDWGALVDTATAYGPAFLIQTALGGVFGVLWLRTGSISVIVLAHAFFNVGNALLHGLSPDTPQAAIMRSTSETISRRWTGLERTFAPSGAREPSERATAAKPVMNMMRSSGVRAAARRATSMPSTPGMTMSVSSRS